MEHITPSVFINTVFPSDLLGPGEVPLLVEPSSFIGDSGQPVTWYRPHNARRAAGRVVGRPGGWLYGVSTVAPRPDGKLKRTLDDVRFAYALVLDDIGTKSVASPVAPSYVLETSPGNFQHGFLIDPFDVSTPRGQAYYDACLVSCARAGFNDPGMRSATRVAKVPGAVHKSGFVTRVVSWDVGRVWDLVDLMGLMGVGVKPGRRVAGALKVGAVARISEVQDGLYDWLVANWTIYGHNAQWVHIECPFRAYHTDGAQGLTSTGYSPLEYGRAGRGFKCLHGHCGTRNAAEFFNHFRARGAQWTT